MLANAIEFAPRIAELLGVCDVTPRHQPGHFGWAMGIGSSLRAPSPQSLYKLNREMTKKFVTQVIVPSQITVLYQTP